MRKYPGLLPTPGNLFKKIVFFRTFERVSRAQAEVHIPRVRHHLGAQEL
jgi:hypothetical protein